MQYKLNFLLADDDADDREMFEQALAKIDPSATLHVVTDGRQAVDYLAGCADGSIPCGIILDYNMPHMNGPDVLDWLCAQKRMNGLNKFVWSTRNQPEYIDGCMGKGAIDYFIKPHSDEQLLAIVQNIYDYCHVHAGIEK